jgi:stearoyl-CoA desaturase (Delta-9 desaturase)
MKSHNLIGYTLLILQAAASWYFAPPALGPWLGLTLGMLYFTAIWFLSGLYLSDVIHMGITHGTLDYKPWFIKTVTFVSNTVGIYVNPITWVNRHRHHHKFADHDGDPNKLHDDGFWRTLYLCLFPYPCKNDYAKDAILKSTTFRLVSNPVYAVFSQFASFGLVWLLFHDWKFALVLWGGLRLFALWVNLIQNYWTHDRRFGTRRYHDEHDNAMNIGDWLPVMATFSACLQNNHHHYPYFLRTSHDESEFDFGFMTVRVMKSLGLVKASSTGANMPADLPLREIGF